jgi:Rps23 Pro-64 3,4-dihydroxylase Tpa1-like proline 4-hydroxylase
MARLLLDKTGRPIFSRDALTAFKVIYFFSVLRKFNRTLYNCMRYNDFRVCIIGWFFKEKLMIIKINGELLEGQDPD